MFTAGKRLLLSLACVLALHCGVANATAITYTATDLNSVETGLWQLDFTLSGYAFTAGQGFQIFFDYGQYKNLAFVSAPTGWDVLVFQPEDILGSLEPGVLDGMALVDNPALDQTFSLRLTWLGSGLPASPAFDIYAADFSVIGSGVSSAAVPLPAAAWLLAPSLAAMAVRRRRA